MRGQTIPLSAPRRFIIDLLNIANRIPSVPVERRIDISTLMMARRQQYRRSSWPALFLKAYSRVAERMPVLRRAYVTLPWPHLCEYPSSVCSIAVERDYEGEPAVFFGRIGQPDRLTLSDIDDRIDDFRHAPVESVKPFRKLLKLGRMPGVLRRFLLWLGLNLSRCRAGQFGTFGLSVYSSLGAQSLHPISPLTTTLTYGTIDADGMVDVRIVYDHRVTDGATIARALAMLEEELNSSIVEELNPRMQIVIHGPMREQLVAATR